MKFDKDVNWQTHTDGSSLWASGIVKTVRITRVVLDWDNDEGSWGELRAYFESQDWDSASLGLIYTDRNWIQEFRALMKTQGFSPVAVEDINYSEQGMQGLDFVSMDVSENFLREVEPMYRFVINQEAVNA